jgi:hypothetical protein
MFVGDGEQLVTVADALEQHRAGGAPPMYPWATVVQLDDGTEHLGKRISFGSLRRFAVQLPLAADRVAAGALGIVRSAVLDVPQGNYLLFEPQRDEVRIGLAIANPSPWSTAFPDGRPLSVERLLDGIESEKAVMLARAEHNRFDPAVLPSSLVVESLRREGALGVELADAMGWSDDGG